MTYVLSSRKTCIGKDLLTTFKFIRYDQDQQHLLRKNVADWVKEDSLECYVSDVVDHLETRADLVPFIR
jgi:hypothetical protein